METTWFFLASWARSKIRKLILPGFPGKFFRHASAKCFGAATRPMHVGVPRKKQFIGMLVIGGVPSNQKDVGGGGGVWTKINYVLNKSIDLKTLLHLHKTGNYRDSCQTSYSKEMLAFGAWKENFSRFEVVATFWSRAI